MLRRNRRTRGGFPRQAHRNACQPWCLWMDREMRTACSGRGLPPEWRKRKPRRPVSRYREAGAGALDQRPGMARAAAHSGPRADDHAHRSRLGRQAGAGLKRTDAIDHQLEDDMQAGREANRRSGNREFDQANVLRGGPGADHRGVAPATFALDGPVHHGHLSQKPARARENGPRVCGSPSRNRGSGAPAGHVRALSPRRARLRASRWH